MPSANRFWQSVIGNGKPPDGSGTNKQELQRLLKEKMALLDNLFSKKAPSKIAPEPVTDLGHTDTSPPSHASTGSHSAERKSLRLGRRELLYAVVRESMARVGMLSSSYKYKVLSLDPRGRQYLIMMDLPQALAVDPGRLAEIEAVIAQNAKARHDIGVTAVYWRINEPVMDGLLRQPRAVADASAQEAQATRLPEARGENADKPQSPKGAARFEPIREDEVAAFKQALAAGITSAPATPSGKLIKSWPRNPASQADFADTQLQEPQEKNVKTLRPSLTGQRDFADTEVVESVEKSSPLSNTQYGDLN